MDFGNLIKVLENETEIYKNIMETENEKTAVIIEGDVEKLDGILNVEQGLHMKARNIEKSRIAALKVLELEQKSLPDVIALSESGQKEKLMKLFGELNGYVSTIKKINEHNIKMVKSRLEIISAVNNMYIDPKTGTKATHAGSSKGETMYGKDAKISQKTNEFERATVRKKL